MHSSDNLLFFPLRQLVDNCIQIFADLDKKFSITYTDIHNAFDKVVEAYDKVKFFKLFKILI